jgi:hypothetical protein
LANKLCHSNTGRERALGIFLHCRLFVQETLALSKLYRLKLSLVACMHVLAISQNPTFKSVQLLREGRVRERSKKIHTALIIVVRRQGYDLHPLNACNHAMP